MMTSKILISGTERRDLSYFIGKIFPAKTKGEEDPNWHIDIEQALSHQYNDDNSKSSVAPLKELLATGVTQIIFKKENCLEIPGTE